MKIPYFPKVKTIEHNPEKMEVMLSIHVQLQNDSVLKDFMDKAYERYYSWEKFSNIKMPNGKYTHETLWFYMKFFVRAQDKQLYLFKDKDARPFKLSITDTMLKQLHSIDRRLADNILADHFMFIDDNQKKVWMQKKVISSLINEAITSSQIEGAATTRKHAKQLIKSGKSPKNHDEKMILNNYIAISKITRELYSEELSIELILKLHEILAKEALADGSDVGVFRETDDINVLDDDGTVLYVPPLAKEVKQRIADLCDFINDDKEFYHPVLKAIILHFAIGYIHPFVDGNGRTARALFYWYLIRKGYSLFEYVSISEHIKNSMGQYKKAYLNVEHDGSDLTYFVYYHLNVINKCIDDIDRYLNKKMEQYNSIKKRLRGRDDLNLRQIDLLNHALRNKDARYTIKSHMQSNRIAWASSRLDLMGLAEKGLLEKKKDGRELVFLVPLDLEDELEGCNEDE